MLKVAFEEGTSLVIQDYVLTPVFDYLARAGFEYESGGIILGSRKRQGEDYYVDSLTLPSTADERAPFSFVRNSIEANKLINEAWLKSNGRVNYLGEWHTHNERTPHPSFVDKRLMKQVSEEGSCLFERAFMIIIGNEEDSFIGMVDTNTPGSFLSETVIEINKLCL